MNYEIDFIGVKNQTKDALAICLRWYSEQAKRYIVVVYDGGYKEHGEEMCGILKKYYFADGNIPMIDLVICSHSDEDHSLGLTVLFDHFTVKNLVMNRPWRFLEELEPYVGDGRKTTASIERELREIFSAVDKLEQKAIELGTKVYDGFRSKPFAGVFSSLRILAPAKETYLKRIIESSKTPFVAKSSTEHISRGLLAALLTPQEIWEIDSLREDVTTTPENETSIVLMGDMGRKKFLLTGDAGKLALSEAADYAEAQGIDLKCVNVHQIPHHGCQVHFSV